MHDTHNLLLELEMTRVDKRKTKCRSGIVMILKSLEKRITKKEQRVKVLKKMEGLKLFLSDKCVTGCHPSSPPPSTPTHTAPTSGWRCRKIPHPHPRPHTNTHMPTNRSEKSYAHQKEKTMKVFTTEGFSLEFREWKMNDTSICIVFLSKNFK